MKRAILTIGLLGMSLWGVDFSQMTTKQLIDMRGTVVFEDRDAYNAEMKSRLSTISTDDRSALTSSRQATSLGVNQPQFSTIDTNHDGQLSLTELESAKAARLEANTADGRLLQNAKNAPDFSAIDVNGDGFVSQDEFSAIQATMVANRSSNGGMGTRRGQGKPAGGQGLGQRLRDGSGAGSMNRGQHHQRRGMNR